MIWGLGAESLQPRAELRSEKAAHHGDEEPRLAVTRDTPAQQPRPSTAKNTSVIFLKKLVSVDFSDTH